jgi:tetratricopeptide (TPR) repeat protein
VNYIKGSAKLRLFMPARLVSVVSSLVMAVTVAGLLSACGSAPTQPSQASGRVNPNVKAANVPEAARGEYLRVLAAVEKQDWVTAEPLLIQMQASYPKLSSIRAMLGWIYWQGGKAEQAITYLDDLTQQQALYKSDAYNYLAIIYREQGKFTQAETVYKQALVIWPQDPVLHKNIGILYELYLIRLPDALVHYQQVLAFEGDNKQINGWVKDLQRRTKK